MAMHSRWKRARRSNNALMVVQCDGPISPARVERAMDGFLEVCPWPAARLRRFPLGKLHWAAGRRGARSRPRIRHATVSSIEELHRELETELNAAIDPRREPPLRFLVAAGAPARAPGALVLTWFHPLMDPRGGQNLLAHLGAIDRNDGRPPWGAEPPAFTPARDPRPLRERGRVARRSLEHMRNLSPVAPVSPGTGRGPFGASRFWQESYVERDAARGGGHASREIAWRLALVGRAMADHWKRRGLPETPFLLPISADLRAKGDPGPVFGNMLGFHFARFSPAETADASALAVALRRQLTDAVRDGQIDANATAMEFLHYRPVSRMLRALPWTSGGETFSFNCADIGEFPAVLDRCFGRRVVNAYHVPAVMPRPGIGVFFNGCAGTSNLVVSWVEGAVSGDEVDRIVEIVREGMGWARVP